MLAKRLPLALVALVLGNLAASRGQDAASKPKTPKVAEGWSIALVVEAPDVLFPTAAVSAPDGTLYVGQDPMDMPGPPYKPIDSIVAIKNGKVRLFADQLWAVMGLEWIGDTLYVMHPPYLSALRDTDGDGKADSRVDIATGLGPKVPGFSGINDHVASGMRIGIDGYLYIAVGDKGIPKGVGKDGATIQLFGGGVIRIRPDGSGLEVVSTGERNPLSAALSARDDVFTYGNDDDSKKWPNSLTHHIMGAHFGYPYEFLNAPFRTLPIMAGQLGGSGCQGICYNEDGLPKEYSGNLFFCDWGLQTVFRYVIEPNGGSFKVASKTPFVTKGELDDLRPFSMAVAHDGASLYLVDWAFSGWLANGPKTGRIYQLKYEGKESVASAPRSSSSDIPSLVKALDHPALTVRREAQQSLSAKGEEAIAPLQAKLDNAKESANGRIHALWALDAIPGAKPREVILGRVADPDFDVRLQACRSVGIHRDPKGISALASLLRDQHPAIRRDAAIALERIGDPSGIPSLLEALGDADTFAAWSIRHALRSFPSIDPGSLAKALVDPKRAEDALKVCDESWSLSRLEALRLALPDAKDSGFRARIVACLAGNSRKYPDWSGNWFGTNPLAGDFPQKTKDWDKKAMALIQSTLASSLKDSDAGVRLQVIAGLVAIGKPAAPLLREALPNEANPRNASAIASGLGVLLDYPSVETLAAVLADKGRPDAVRVAALDALGRFRGPKAYNARLAVVYDAESPAPLVALALPNLGRDGLLPPNDMSAFLDNEKPSVRIAALNGLAKSKNLPGGVRESIVRTLEDKDVEVKKAASETVAALRISEAIPTLLNLANQAEIRDEAGNALAAMPDLQALPIYLAGLRDINPSRRAAAASALTVIREEARTDLVKAAGSGRYDGPAALVLERLLTRFQPVTRWKVIGAFARTTPRVFMGERSIDFSQSHSGVEGRSIAWIDRLADKATGRLSIEDFKGGIGNKGGFGYDTNGSPDLCAFGYAEIESPDDRSALLMFGSSGSLVVTLNEATIHTYRNFSGRAFSPESDLVRLDLKKGTNRLVVQSRQGIGSWSFSAAVSEPGSIVVKSGTKGAGVEELRTFAMTHEGDPKSGEVLFFDAKGIGCVKCHAAGGKGTSNIGPDLTGLASKYDRAEIIRSVLEPSNRIATGYQPALIATEDGRVITGLVRSENETSIELVDSEVKTIHVLKSEIEERKLGNISVMPAGIVDSLTVVQFADLVSYLRSLKAPGTAPAH